MAVITMQLTSLLIEQLKLDFPTVQFRCGDEYKWSPTLNTVTYASQEMNVLFLLHELAHALLKHTNFPMDIELVTQERDAWALVRTNLSPRYNVLFDQEAAERAMDTYRNWLDVRSRCPTCDMNGIQTKTSTYLCMNCRCSWRPNDARQCALRRYRLTP